MPFVEIKGKRSYYAGETTRPGLPVLFCHGSGGSHRHWLYQLTGLSEPVNPLAVDLPGHGRSEGNTHDTIAGYREWIKELTLTLGLSHFILGGHSMGGALAMDYALHYPDGLAGLILVGTGARLRVAPAILENLRGGRVPAGMAEYAYGPDASKELLQEGEREMQATPAALFLSDFTACDRFNIMTELPRITQRSLIICGEADRLTPVKYSRFLEQALSAGELVEVPKAGHMVMVEAPEAVNTAVSRFVEKLIKK
ncbi:MAG: alpha/beta hydrolase [Bacillota bacterium]